MIPYLSHQINQHTCLRFSFGEGERNEGKKGGKERREDGLGLRYYPKQGPKTSHIGNMHQEDRQLIRLKE